LQRWDLKWSLLSNAGLAISLAAAPLESSEGEIMHPSHHLSFYSENWFLKALSFLSRSLGRCWNSATSTDLKDDVKDGQSFVNLQTLST